MEEPAPSSTPRSTLFVISRPYSEGAANALGRLGDCSTRVTIGDCLSRHTRVNRRAVYVHSFINSSSSGCNGHPVW
jgi:hypothetical protein